MRRMSGRGGVVYAVCFAALVALFWCNGGFDPASWADFADNFHQNFIEDERYLMITDGLQATLYMTFFSLLIGLTVGIALSVVRTAARGRGPLCALVNLYVAIMRGTPVMVQLLIWNFSIFANARDVNTLHVAILAFGLNSAAYVAEIFRGGIDSVDHGQMEAARSLGLTYGQSMRRIILPQAVRNTVPMLFNEFVSLLKETSIAGYIGIDDLTRAGQNIQALTMEHSQPLVMVALVVELEVAATHRELV